MFGLSSVLSSNSTPIGGIWIVQTQTSCKEGILANPKYVINVLLEISRLVNWLEEQYNYFNKVLLETSRLVRLFLWHHNAFKLTNASMPVMSLMSRLPTFK